MILGLYLHRRTPIHRVPAAVKVLTLFAAGIGVFLVPNPFWLVPALAAVVGLMVLARVPLGETVRQLRPVAVLIVVIFLVHGWFTSWTLGLLVVARFAVLLLLALLVTFTTRVSEMIDVLERGFRPLSVFGVNPEKSSLMLSLALRFIPLLFAKFQEIQEAQRARGLERNVVALLMPLLIKTLKMAGDLTDAIDARGYDPDGRPMVSRSEIADR
ncbi:MAG: energy-coupling factor transporter transmembrane component T family protein [Rhodospirillales bacterium]